ncbi:hypothetical protein [Variovorax ureilyticus]|uniref:hypothetical protein n=1 Tax=Variovorax ureilyticus TaxID=1836198 RepID=UPI003BF58C52
MNERTTPAPAEQADYAAVHADIVVLLEDTRRAAVRSVNALMTASSGRLVGVLLNMSKMGGSGPHAVAVAATTARRPWGPPWPGFQRGQPGTDAPVISRLSTLADFRDAVPEWFYSGTGQSETASRTWSAYWGRQSSWPISRIIDQRTNGAVVR